MGIDLDVLEEYESPIKEAETQAKSQQRRNSQPKQGKNNQEPETTTKIQK